MITAIEFSGELIDWAARAGFAFTQASVTEEEWRSFIKDRAFFSNRGGEIIYFVAVNENGWLVVTSSERRGREQLEFATRSMFVLERYFFGYFGWYVRSGQGLPRLARPHLALDVQPGFSIRPVEFDGLSRDELSASNGEVIGIGSTADLVTLSLYLNSTVDDIQASYQNSDGGPLFRQRPQRSESAVLAASIAEQSADVAELVGFIAADEYVNGVQEDVIAHRRAGAQYPPIRRDESWTGYVYIFYVGEGFTKSSGFRYDVRQAAMPLSVPFGVTDDTERRITAALARIRDAEDLPLERRWNAAAIVYDRASGRGDVRFFYGRDAEKWLMSPANADQIAAQGSALLHELQGR